MLFSYKKETHNLGQSYLTWIITKGQKYYIKEERVILNIKGFDVILSSILKWAIKIQMSLKMYIDPHVYLHIIHTYLELLFHKEVAYTS